MCKHWGEIGEYVKSLENFRVYIYSLPELYVAGNYMNSLNVRDYVKYLVTHIPCNIYKGRLILVFKK